MAQYSRSSSSAFNESSSSACQGYQPGAHSGFTFTSDFDPTDSLTMTTGSTFSNSVDDQLADFGSIFSDSFPSYQAPDLDVTKNFTASNHRDEIHSTDPAYCMDDLSFTGSWMDKRPTAPFLPSTLFPTSNEQARGPEKEVVEDKTQCSSCHKSKPQKSQGHFECGWKNCQKPGPFTRKSVLKRHIDTLHISPRSFVCPSEHCGKSFNRKDNLDDHFRRVHWEKRI
ncbi:Zinc finger C2H2 [Penicillium malachiteum]|nr:Zinc finger C2H2 [Penicillium malachiteum]